MLNDEELEKLQELIETFDGELCDLCFKLIKQYDDDIVAVFEYVCENLFAMPDKKKIPIDEVFSQKEILRYSSILGDIVNGLISTTIRKCDYGMFLPENFYKALWQAYCINFTEEKEKAFAFAYTVRNKKIPYQYLGKPLSMENNTYRALVGQNMQMIERMEYIANVDYKQKTESASLILHCLDEIEDYESKVVVLANALQLFAMDAPKMDFDEFFKMMEEFE